MFYRKLFIVISIFMLSIASWINYINMEKSSARDTLSTSAIRFHVLANSDSIADQQLKMAIKEKVVDYIYTNTGDFTNINEARNFIVSHDDEILNLGRNTMTSMGYNYSITSHFGREIFPTKSYGDVVFPSGEYTSYTLSIGNGKGHNWWCVLYPPLCFVDASTGVVPESSKERLQESLTNREYQSVVKYRFKYLTFLNKYLP